MSSRGPKQLEMGNFFCVPLYRHTGTARKQPINAVFLALWRRG